MTELERDPIEAHVRQAFEFLDPERGWRTELTDGGWLYRTLGFVTTTFAFELNLDWRDLMVDCAVCRCADGHRPPEGSRVHDGHLARRYLQEALPMVVGEGKVMANQLNRKLARVPRDRTIAGIPAAASLFASVIREVGTDAFHEHRDELFPPVTIPND